MSKSREVRYDVIRVVAMLFVIAVHVNPKPFNSFPWFKEVFDYIIYTCNGMFFMLSGLFSIKKNYSSKEDYALYYKKKVVSILVPYIVMTFILYGHDYYQSGRAFELRLFVEETINQFTALNSEQHLWFMYSLIGLLMSAPFFSKMLRVMSDWEVKLLFWLSIGWNAVSIYLINDLGWNFHYGKWIMASWTIYFFLGYFHDRIIREKDKKFWYILGIAGFLVTVLWQYVLPVENHSDKDFAPAYTFFVIGMYTFLLYEVKITWGWLKSLIVFLARHSFSVYLIHYLILEMIGQIFYYNFSAKTGFVLTYLICLICSVIFAVIFDLMLDTLVQKPLKKVFKI